MFKFQIFIAYYDSHLKNKLELLSQYPSPTVKQINNLSEITTVT